MQESGEDADDYLAVLAEPLFFFALLGSVNAQVRCLWFKAGAVLLSLCRGSDDPILFYQSVIDFQLHQQTFSHAALMNSSHASTLRPQFTCLD